MSELGNFDWGDVKVFLAIHKSGSFGKAAEDLGITQPTVSRKIESLEQQIGSKIFTRGKQGAKLTATGEALLEIAQRMSMNAAAIAKLTPKGNDDVTGTVRLRLQDSLASLVVAPRLPAFLSLHPKLSISIDTDINSLDDADTDILLQYKEPNNINLLRTPVGMIHYSYFASPDYLDESGGEMDSVAEATAHRLILHNNYLQHHEALPKKQKALQFIGVDEAHILTDSGPLNIALIQNGLGVGVLPTVAVDVIKDLRPAARQPESSASVQLYMFHAKGADKNKALLVCKNWLLNVFEEISWFGEDYIDPYEVWKNRYDQ